MIRCNRFSVHKPTSVYRRDKYAAIKENIYVFACKIETLKKKGKKAPLFDCLRKRPPPLPYNHLDSFTALSLFPFFLGQAKQSPTVAVKGGGYGRGGGMRGRGPINGMQTDTL